MFAAVDVQYAQSCAGVGCILFDQWDNSAPTQACELQLDTQQPYMPGEFYKRELPCILAILEKLNVQLDCVVIDGYAWLGDEQPGLGEHLFRALGGGVPVIGVAKQPFTGNEIAVSLFRGTSRRPLFVTASGLPIELAVASIAGMHGAFRIPTLLTCVDALSRRAAKPSSTS